MSLPTVIINIGNSAYISAASPSATVDRGVTHDTSPWPLALPVTIVPALTSNSMSNLGLRNELNKMLETDDVLCQDFTSHVVFNTPPSQWVILDDDVHTVVESWRCCHSGEDLSGPFLLFGNNLHRVFKLYRDDYAAFIYGVLPESSLSFIPAPTNPIPVPSRLYFPPQTTEKPLSGMRVAVKDIYDIRGLVTGVGSKAYTSFHETSPQTAPVIENLIDAGAVIVGKTKTVQFASGMASRDWIDYQCPFNPRGDGYLDPGCSSTGSAAAIAGYEWLDFAIGSDSLGSMVGPAAACGVFGIRPSKGLLSNEGALAVSSLLDTPGCFARDIQTLAKVMKILTVASIPREFGNTSAKIRILYPQRMFESFPQSKVGLMGDFLKGLESWTNIRHTPFDIEQSWQLQPFSCSSNKTLGKYLESTVATIQLHDSYRNNLEYRCDYKNYFGHEPPADALVRFKWDLGAKIREDQYKEACDQAKNFKSFLENEVFTDGTIMLLPGGDSDVRYRDDYPGELEASGMKWQGYGFKSTTFSVLGGIPSISFPVGQRAYESKTTRKSEMQPVSMMVLGRWGSDSWLIDIIESVLAKLELPTEVLCGKNTFEV